jgi:hypothetical protein
MLWTAPPPVRECREYGCCWCNPSQACKQLSARVLAVAAGEAAVVGRIVTTPILYGLHHCYARICKDTKTCADEGQSSLLASHFQS